MHILVHGELLQNKQYGAVRRGRFNILFTFHALSIIPLQIEAESSFCNIVFNKNGVMDNVPKVTKCTDILLS
jgi:hypothetical protein